MMDNLYRKTPIMGWASWNCFRTNITEEKLKEQIDALKITGLDKYGYTYFNIDDGFFGGRDKNGVLQFHKERFPNGIKVIADYAHQNGLQAGIYSDGGDKTLVHNKKQKIIVYCSTGKRSSQAKYTLDYMGYKNVFYLGGIEL